MLDDKYLCRMKLNGLKVRADTFRVFDALLRFGADEPSASGALVFFWCGIPRGVRWLRFVYAVNRQQGGSRVASAGSIRHACWMTSTSAG
jgi:hypothetical protein